jgi:hypothetical protein
MKPEASTNRSAFFAVFGLVLGGLGSWMMWRFWTPLCNEACPSWVGLSMIGFAAALPLVCAAVGAVAGAVRFTPQQKIAIVLPILAIAAALAWWLTQSVK